MRFYVILWNPSTERLVGGRLPPLARLPRRLPGGGPARPTGGRPPARRHLSTARARGGYARAAARTPGTGDPGDDQKARRLVPGPFPGEQAAEVHRPIRQPRCGVGLATRLAPVLPRSH